MVLFLGVAVAHKSPAAISLGRLGELNGDNARAAKLSAKVGAKVARKAAKIRWNKQLISHRLNGLAVFY